MRISVIIPSRGRSRQLSAILHSLRLLESGKHTVWYGVCADADDADTKAFCNAVMVHDNFPLAMRCGPRPVSLGAVVNDMCLRMPADAYAALCDDLICVTPGWDAAIAQATEKTPHGVFWWKNALPQEATYAIVTEKWRQAAGGMFTSFYPFWYDDLHLLELWMMTTDLDPIILDIAIADKPVKTQRMRELGFWCDFYTKTRGLRAKQALHIAQVLDLPKPKLIDIFVREFKVGLENMTAERRAEIENNQGDPTPADASYHIAKANAVKILKILEDAHAV